MYSDMARFQAGGSGRYLVFMDSGRLKLDTSTLSLPDVFVLASEGSDSGKLW